MPKWWITSIFLHLVVFYNVGSLFGYAPTLPSVVFNDWNGHRCDRSLWSIFVRRDFMLSWHCSGLFGYWITYGLERT